MSATHGLILTALLLAACGDKDDGGADSHSTDDGGGTTDGRTDGGTDGGTDTTIDLAGACPADQRWGGFVVGAYDDQGYSIVDGSVSDGVVPVTIPEEAVVEGECRLLRRNNLYCHPSCEADETCDFDNSCIPYPTTQDLGTVSITGLEGEVVMDPVTPGFTYFNTSLAHPGFVDGATIRLSSTGGGYAPLALEGRGFSTIQPTQTEWTVTDGQPLTLGWDAPTGTVETQVLLTLNIDQHGTSPLSISCDFLDDGEGTVPANIISTLVDAGVTGFPSGSLTRRTVDSVTIEAATGDAGTGCVELVVASPRRGEVSVYGYTPCTSDDDCPTGQECNLALEICE